MPRFSWTVAVHPNTGCQKKFYPLYAFGGANVNVSDTTWDDAAGFQQRHANIAGNTNLVYELTNLDASTYNQWQTFAGKSFVKMRFAEKQLHNDRILGVEVAVDTTQAGNDWARRGVLLERGVVPAAQAHAEQFGSVYCNLMPGQECECEIKLSSAAGRNLLCVVAKVHCMQAIVTQNVGAHLVIDLGNTRTIALLLKDDVSGQANQAGAIRNNCKGVLLRLDARNRGMTKDDILNVDSGVMDSWMVLRQNEFDENAPAVVQKHYTTGTRRRFLLGTETFNEYVETRLPTMFVEYSPVAFGDEAKNCLANSDVVNMIDHGLNLQQSSPKRYFFDNEQSQRDWSMVLNTQWKNTDPAKLKSNSLLWMTEKGDVVNPEDIAQLSLRPMRGPEHPNYPRAATFVWMVLGIIERAYAQLNGLGDLAAAFIPYELKDVIVTYPSGWTRDEIALYRKRCEDAIKIFELSHFAGEGTIKLHMDVDEAVASQLPYVFSEIHKFADNVDGWLRIAGKRRENGEIAFRMMNFDIGGGTSDISVLEYTGRVNALGTIELQPKLLFRDGYSEAGDSLMRRIIHEVVFASIRRQDESLGNALGNYFTGEMVDATVKNKRVKALKLVVVPLAIRVMADIASGAPAGAFRLSAAGVGMQTFDDLYNNLGLPNVDTRQLFGRLEIRYDVAEVDGIVRDFFAEMMDNVGEIAAKFDIDVFFMRGKTSELPEIHRLALERLPLTPDRILAAKHYRAGDWYPFVQIDNGGVVQADTIKDAKSITAVGAALDFMLRNGKVQNWTMKPTQFGDNFYEGSEWGFMGNFARPNAPVFEFGEDGVATTEINLTNLIGRRMSRRAAGSAIYRLKRTNPQQVDATREVFDAKIRRGEDRQTKAEYLELVELVREGETGNCADDYTLEVCQRVEEFWQDTGRII